MEITTGRTPSAGAVGRRAVLAAAAAALAGCSRGGDPGTGPRPSDSLVVSESAAEVTDAFGAPSREVLDALHRRRGAALLAGDERAFLDGLDPSATTLLDGQRRLLANLTGLDVAAVSLVTPRTADLVKVGDGYDVPVTHVIRLTADAGPVGVGTAETFTYRFRRRGDGWMVTDVVPDDQCVLTPWSLTGLTVARAGAVWVAGDSTVPEVASFAGVAAAESAFVRKLWGDRITFPGSVLFLTRDGSAFDGWFSPKSRPGKVPAIEGVAPFGRYADRDGERFTTETPAARVVVNLGKVERTFGSVTPGGDAARETRLVVRHELVHALTARVEARTDDLGFLTGDVIRWAVEGFAVMVQYLDQPDRQRNRDAVVRDGVRRGWFDGSLPASKTFYDDARMSFHYMLSSTVFEFVRRRDLAAAVEFYDRVHRLADLDEPSYLRSSALDAACRAATGLATPAFLQQWSAHVRSL